MESIGYAISGLTMEEVVHQDIRWTLGAEGGPQLTASKERGTAVLQEPQGTEFCQQQE